MHASLPFLASMLMHATVLGWVYLAPAAPEPSALESERFAEWVRMAPPLEAPKPLEFVDFHLPDEARRGGAEPAEEAAPAVAEATPAATEEPPPAPVAERVAEPEPERPRERRRRTAPPPEVEPVVTAEADDAPAIPLPEPSVESEPPEEPATAALEPGPPPVPPGPPAPNDDTRVASLGPIGSSGGAGSGTTGAGATGGNARGSGGSDGEGAGAGDSVDADALYARYSRSLDRIVQRNRDYPRTAQRAGIQGTVLLEVRIDAEGRILGIEVRRSSGHGILDRAAVASIESIGAFPPPPSEVAWDHRPIRIPMRYTL